MPVDPGESGGEIAGVPVDAARGPELPPQALFDVLDWLKVAEQDLPQQGDVGDG